MDPCPFVRILIGNLALKFPESSSNKQSLSRIHSSASSCYCKIKLKNFSEQVVAAVPLIQQQEPQPEGTQETLNNSISSSSSSSVLCNSVAACFSLDKTQIEKISENASKNVVTSLRIDVYKGKTGASCLATGDKFLGRVSLPLDLRGVESRVSMIHNGWVGIGGNKKRTGASQLYATVRAEPDPRFVFKFGGEPECSPQVFQVQGNVKQAVFTCKFGFRNSGDRNLVSRHSMAEQSTSRNWLPLFGGSDKDQSSKERKGWSITIHDLSGSPVAMASMVTPFVPTPGSDRVSRSNPGAWLILRPGNCTWKPWGRLEAWREPGSSESLGYRFDLLHDTTTTTMANSTLSCNRGGKFTIDTTTLATPVNSPHSSCDLGSGYGSGSFSAPGSRPGSGSGSDFAFNLWPQFMYRGFVMSSTVEGVGKCGGDRPELEIGVQHVTCTEDAAAFVALAAALDLSVDACRPFSQKLRKELRQQSQKAVV